MIWKGPLKETIYRARNAIIASHEEPEAQKNCHHPDFYFN